MGAPFDQHSFHCKIDLSDFGVILRAIELTAASCGSGWHLDTVAGVMDSSSSSRDGFDEKMDGAVVNQQNLCFGLRLFFW